VIDPQSLNKIEPRLLKEKNIWLATVRPNGRPHLVPIWYVWHQVEFWICTGQQSRKVKNLQANPAVMFSLEDGDHPLIFEGQARLITRQPFPEEIALLFKKKYDWDFRTESDDYGCLIVITPTRMLQW
jgi:PPOX class probable F420-dependent enzyme